MNKSDPTEDELKATVERDQRTCYTADPEGNLIEIGAWNKPFEEKDAGR